MHSAIENSAKFKIGEYTFFSSYGVSLFPLYSHYINRYNPLQIINVKKDKSFEVATYRSYSCMVSYVYTVHFRIFVSSTKLRISEKCLSKQPVVLFI